MQKFQENLTNALKDGVMRLESERERERGGQTFFLDLLIEVLDVNGLIRGNITGQHRRRFKAQTEKGGERGNEEGREILALEREVRTSDD